MRGGEGALAARSAAASVKMISGGAISIGSYFVSISATAGNLSLSAFFFLVPLFLCASGSSCHPIDLCSFHPLVLALALSFSFVIASFTQLLGSDQVDVRALARADGKWRSPALFVTLNTSLQGSSPEDPAGACPCTDFDVPRPNRVLRRNNP